MKRKKRQGVAIVEFSFAMVVMIPLFLGTVGLGLRLIQSLRVAQLSRDADRMYARGLDFSQPGNKTTLASLGADVGLKTDGTGTAVVILTLVTYIDKGMCQSAGYPTDASGNPIGCPNWKKWVFAQRLVIGNSSIRTSNLGSPLTTGPDPVTVDSTTGKISLDDQVNNSGDRANFASGNPFVDTSDGDLNTLPSGQVLYVTEVAVPGFSMPPFAGANTVYSYNVF
ncbi:MAG TPA: TadE family protein [Candidatus Acidoferrales bacterium]|nr:TadE family protein [Candidatus Acidoferrales bacterium]